jgi:alkylation response protein AidB-like acyl-CoA dehydrogenase
MPWTQAAGMQPAQRLLDDIEALAPTIRARAAEAETARQVPIELIQALKSIGVFRMFAPRSRDGLELDLPSALAVIHRLGKIDGSVGWTAMIGSTAALFAPMLSRGIYDQIYQDGPNVIFAGSARPDGTARAVPGGWRVTGRWPFASGCRHADWMIGFCVMNQTDGPMPGLGVSAEKVVRGFILPARDWTIEDTWHTSGLKGTGSHHIALIDTVVPAANFFHPVDSVPCVPGPLYQAVLQLLPLMHCAVTVGMAAGALDDLVTLADTGRRQLGAAVPLRQSEIFQSELGRVAVELKAADALLWAQADSHWRHALAGTLRNDARLTEGGQAAAWLAGTCAHIAEACFLLGGSAALYETSPLQRRLRDLQAAAQHAASHRRHYISAGKDLLRGSDN